MLDAQGTSISIRVLNSGIFSGAMIPPIINAFLMEKNYKYFLISVVSSQVVCILSFFGIWALGKQILKYRSALDNQVEAKSLTTAE